jgi:hypothetical protein
MTGVEIGAIGSIWYQIGQVFFLSTAFFSNPIPIRICIIIGNFLFVVNAAVGWPFWPDISRKPYVLAIDTIIWEGVIGSFNIFKLIQEIRAWRKKKNEDKPKSEYLVNNERDLSEEHKESNRDFGLV